jgi:hypothetical protein
MTHPAEQIVHEPLPELELYVPMGQINCVMAPGPGAYHPACAAEQEVAPASADGIELEWNDVMNVRDVRV